MRLVIAETSPVNYLLLIGHIDILPALFDKIFLPVTVQNELSHPRAPLVVRKWIAAPPVWANIRQPSYRDPSLTKLDEGEADAICLAVELRADLLLMDDEEGVAAAHHKGLEVSGTLGVLALAARRNQLNLPDAFERIKRTNDRGRQRKQSTKARERLPKSPGHPAKTELSLTSRTQSFHI